MSINLGITTKWDPNTHGLLIEEDINQLKRHKLLWDSIDEDVNINDLIENFDHCKINDKKNKYKIEFVNMYVFEDRFMARTNKTIDKFIRKIQKYYKKENMFLRRSLYSLKYREIKGKFPQNIHILKLLNHALGRLETQTAKQETLMNSHKALMEKHEALLDPK